jgi:hypothetical protein
MSPARGRRKGQVVRFDIYGIYRLEVVREDGSWAVYYLGDGKRRIAHDLVVPSSIQADEVQTYLDDILHELARPGNTIRRLD